MSLGTDGQGVSIASLEKIIKGALNDDYIFCLSYGEKGNKYDEHGTLVMDYIMQVAPEAYLSSVKSKEKISNGRLESAAMEYLMEYKPDLIGTANHGGFIDNDVCKPYYQKLYDEGCYLICSAGNEQEEINKLAMGDLWKAVGACRYNQGKPKVEKVYVDGEEMDFVSLHKLKSAYDGKVHLGTSFSYPIMMGMLALVQCFFINKTGKKLNNEQINRFVKDHCLDLEEEGTDEKTGYGLFILPDPESIDIKKYADNYSENKVENKITLTINSNMAIIEEYEGRTLLRKRITSLDSPPKIIKNRTMVPIRFIAEELGCKVTWDEANRQVIIER